MSHKKVTYESGQEVRSYLDTVLNLFIYKVLSEIPVFKTQKGHILFLWKFPNHVHCTKLLFAEKISNSVQGFYSCSVNLFTRFGQLLWSADRELSSLEEMTLWASDKLETWKNLLWEWYEGKQEFSINTRWKKGPQPHCYWMQSHFSLFDA